jgi:hypothetical protein
VATGPPSPESVPAVLLAVSLPPDPLGWVALTNRLQVASAPVGASVG